MKGMATSQTWEAAVVAVSGNSLTAGFDGQRGEVWVGRIEVWHDYLTYHEGEASGAKIFPAD